MLQLSLHEIDQQWHLEAEPNVDLVYFATRIGNEIVVQAYELGCARHHLVATFR